MRYVVVGAGVAGVCCARELLKRLEPGDQLTLVAPGDVLKCVENVQRVTHRIDLFDVVSRPLDWLAQPSVTVLKALATGVDGDRRTLLACDAEGHSFEVAYDRLCLACGARPRQLPAAVACMAAAAQHVLTLRDTDNLCELLARLRHARRVLLVGNGGIALELAEALCALARHDVVWVVRHGGLGDAFFDRDAADFLLGVMSARRAAVHGTSTRESRQRVEMTVKHVDATSAPPAGSSTCGAAVGPRWTERLMSLADESGGAHGCAGLQLELNCELEALESSGDDTWPLVAVLTSGVRVSVDAVIVAVGVVPSVEWAPVSWHRAPDGGLAVDARMRVAGAPAGVFAAGDAASAVECALASPHWHQMRLWSQARAAGTFAAACMAEAPEEELLADCAFELFTHCTRFLGQRVVLLGRYNAQGLEAHERSDLCTYSRVTPPGPDGEGGAFIRVLLLRGRMRGAVLIGDDACDLAETFEHLILDELDVSELGPHLLDPDVDLEDFFD